MKLATKNGIETIYNKNAQAMVDAGYLFIDPELWEKCKPAAIKARWVRAYKNLMPVAGTVDPSQLVIEVPGLTMEDKNVQAHMCGCENE